MQVFVPTKNGTGELLKSTLISRGTYPAHSARAKNDLIRYCEDILRIMDYEIFEDAGFSAGSTARPDYQEMMRRIRTGEFTHVIVWKINRISRNIIDFTEMFRELHMLDVTFISLAEQFDTSSIVGQALLKMILIFAELERHNAAERSKAVLLSKAEAGEYTGFRIPFGYRRDPQTKEYSVDEPEANISSAAWWLWSIPPSGLGPTWPEAP